MNKYFNKTQNAQMIHILHSYRSSLKSSPSHNWQCPVSWLFHSTLQQNDCTSSSFPIALSPWVKVKVIHSGIILQSLAVSSIIPSLKQIDSKVSCRPMVEVYPKNIKYIEFSPFNISPMKKISISLCKPKACGSILNFWCFVRKWLHNFVHTSLTLNESHGHPNWYKNLKFSGLYHQIKSKRNQ